MSYSPPPEPISVVKKPQPFPWSHQETIHLIKAYEEKWNAMKRGPLGSQWEEVAAALAARCDLSSDEAKSAVQCRHKMEKLRRRYRSERQSVGVVSSSWPYYQVMDALENGPFPSVRPRENHKIRNKVRERYEDYGGEEEDDDDDEEDAKGWSRSRSIGHILKRPSYNNRFSVGPAKRTRDEEEEEEEEETTEEATVATEIRRFAERVMGMERKRMEMTREMELWRMEMENKRMEMILDSEKKILEAIARSE